MLAILTLFFSSVLFFYDIFTGRFLFTERDLAPYFIPQRFFWVESILKGDFPLWNPFQFSGHPLFANPQYAILYPLNSLFFILPFDLAFNSIIILHFFLGGLFTYLLLKDLKVNTTGSLISGLIFMLSGYLLSVHSLLNCLLSVIWTPLIMMFFRRAILRPGIKNEVLTAIFITISFLGGGLEIVYGNFLMLFFMVIFYSGPAAPPVGDKPRRYKLEGCAPIYLRRIKSLVIVSILFLFLSAVQLLPFLELFDHSIRRGGISYQEATTWSFAPKDTLLFFLPDAYGYFLDMKRYWTTQCWLKTLYIGGLPFILSLIFFFTSHLPRSPSDERDGVGGFGKDRKLYLALILFSLFLSLGHYNPLYPFVFKYVPVFNGIRYPVKFLYIFVLILSIVAGLGFQKLVEYSKARKNKKLKKLFMVFSLISGLLLLFLVLGHKEVESFIRSRGIDFPEFNYLPVNLYHAKRFLFYLALFFLLLRIGLEVKWKNWARVLLIFFLTADLFGNMGFYGKEKTSDFLRKTRILEMISQDQAHFRVFSTSKTIAWDAPILVANATHLDILKEKHLPSMNLFYKLQNMWGIDVIRIERADDLYRAFTSAPPTSETHLVDLYGIKYIVSVTPLEEDARFELIYARLEGLEGKREELLKQNTIKLYKNRNPFPRAWLVKDYRVLDSKSILSMMAQKEFRPSQEVFLEEEPEWTISPSAPGRRQSDYGASATFTKGGLGGLNVGKQLSGFSQKVQIMSESNNRLDLTVNAEENSLLVLSDTYYPGWNAFVDGKKTKICRADYTFRAIPLSAGTHRIEFVYDPMSFKLGAAATLLGILGCVVIGLTARRRKPV